MELRFKDGEELSCSVLVKGKTFLFVKDSKTGEYKIVNVDRLSDGNNNLQQQTRAGSVGDGVGGGAV